jgi:hypothetical protein
LGGVRAQARGRAHGGSLRALGAAQRLTSGNQAGVCDPAKQASLFLKTSACAPSVLPDGPSPP